MFVQVKRKLRMGLVDKIEINYKILPSFSLIESNIFYIIFAILMKKDGKILKYFVMKIVPCHIQNI